MARDCRKKCRKRVLRTLTWVWEPVAWGSMVRRPTVEAMPVGRGGTVTGGYERRRKGVPGTAAGVRRLQRAAVSDTDQPITDNRRHSFPDAKSGGVRPPTPDHGNRRLSRTTQTKNTPGLSTGGASCGIWRLRVRKTRAGRIKARSGGRMFGRATALRGGQPIDRFVAARLHRRRGHSRRRQVTSLQARERRPRRRRGPGSSRCGSR